jgi:hypothetical protein
MLIKHVTYTNLGTIKSRVDYALRDSAQESQVDEKIDYVLRDAAKHESEEQFKMTYNLLGETELDFVKQFEKLYDNRAIKRKDSVSLNHTIISFHKDDSEKLDNQKLHALVSEFIRLRSDKTSYLAVEHRDTDHRHLHLLYSNFEIETGKSIRMGNTEFRKLSIDMEAFQQRLFPELENSVIGYAEKMRSKATKVFEQESDKEVEETLKEFQSIRERASTNELDNDRPIFKYNHDRELMTSQDRRKESTSHERTGKEIQREMRSNEVSQKGR